MSIEIKKRQDTSLAKQLYAEDFADYEEYVTEEYGYNGPSKLVSYLTPYLSEFSPVRRSNASTVRILDIGIGHFSPFRLGEFEIGNKWAKHPSWFPHPSSMPYFYGFPEI